MTVRRLAREISGTASSSSEGNTEEGEIGWVERRASVLAIRPTSSLMARRRSAVSPLLGAVIYRPHPKTCGSVSSCRILTNKMDECQPNLVSKTEQNFMRGTKAPDLLERESVGETRLARARQPKLCQP